MKFAMVEQQNLKFVQYNKDHRLAYFSIINKKRNARWNSTSLIFLSIPNILSIYSTKTAQKLNISF